MDVLTETTPLLVQKEDPNETKIELSRRSKIEYESRFIATPFSQRIMFTWSDVNVFTNKRKSRGWFRSSRNESGTNYERRHLLRNVNGVAYPGELLAILGPSGAGKTTLLNTLTFRASSQLIVTGLRAINGVPISSFSFASQAAYVQQEEVFIGTLTVREHLVFQALLRMDRHIPYKQRMIRVDEVIKELGLKDCANTVIGIAGRLKGISGGETKRLSFAAEVLTNPSLMFCDEPTSGLDSFMALNVMQVLKSLAQSGKTIVCTIHQPSSELYAMFDKLLLMSEGRTAFLGTPDEADFFFRDLEAPCPSNYNPADYYIQLLSIAPGKEESCRQGINMICDKFARSDYGVKVSVTAATLNDASANYIQDLNEEQPIRRTRYKARWTSQFRAVLWRSWLTIMKEPMLLKVRLMQTILVAFVIVLIYYGQTLNQEGVMNINGVLFLFLTNMTFQNMGTAINVFCTELPVFLRENRSGMYRTDVYFLCKTMAEMPLFIIVPILFTSICYFLVGLNTSEPRFFVALGIITLIVNVATSLGYMVSCISRNLSMAISIFPPTVVPFMMFGGFFLNVGSIPYYLKWLSYLSWFRYGNEALMINQWSGVDSISCSGSNATCIRSGAVVLEMYHFSEANMLTDVLALVALICGIRICAYLFLLLKTYQSE